MTARSYSELKPDELLAWANPRAGNIVFNHLHDRFPDIDDKIRKTFGLTAERWPGHSDNSSHIHRLYNPISLL